MKIEILLFALTFFSIKTQAQLQAHAGKDRHFCITSNRGTYLSPQSVNLGINDTLGDNPSATGGFPPYKYKWTTLNDVLDTTQTEVDATRFLDNINLPNPKLISVPEKVKLFFLTVTDNLGQITRDTIKISNTNFNLVVDKFYKKTKDTIEIYQQFWGSNNPTCFWQKKSFINDTNSNPTKVWNQVSDSLKAWAVDNYGCKSDTNYIKIYIDNKVSISTFDLEKNFLNYHNPVNSNSVFYLTDKSKIEKIELYNISGAIIYSQEKGKELEIGKQIKEKGVYFLLLHSNEGTNFIKITKD